MKLFFLNDNTILQKNLLFKRLNVLKKYIFDEFLQVKINKFSGIFVYENSTRLSNRNYG